MNATQTPEPTGAQIWDEGIRRLAERVGEPISYDKQDRAQLTPDEACAELADLAEELRERGLLKD